MTLGTDWDPGPLRRLQLELVNVCNYRCPLCRTLARDGVPRRRLELGELRALLTPLAGQLEELTLFGTRGEPFLHPELGPAVAWVKQELGARVEVSTNGSLVDEAAARAVLEAGLDRLVFAVDGLSEASYAAYRRGGTLAPVLANLERLCELRDCLGAPTRVIFQLIPMAQNEHEIAGLPALAYGLGVDQVRLKVSASVAGDAGFRPRAEAHQAAARPPARPDFPCRFGLDKLYVDPNGEVYPCCYGEGRAEASLGNALALGLLPIWRGEAARRYREPFARGGERDPFCVRTCARRRPKRKLKLARPE